MATSAAELLRPALNVLQSFGATALQPSAYPPGADISGMSEAGIPALGLLQDGRTYFNYHHSAADTLDKIVPSELRENGAAMAVMGYALASYERSPAAIGRTAQNATSKRLSCFYTRLIAPGMQSL